MPTGSVIKVQDVKKTFKVGFQDIEVLKGLTFDIFSGEFVIIIGPSGCGKSTLLHAILGLEGPSTGSVELLGVDIYTNRDEDFRSDFRKRNIGMIYQQPNWIKSLTVVENVAFPLTLLGLRKDEALSKAWTQLTQVGMKDWSGYAPTELSSGQQQKIALARALVTEPQIIVADEPTGNLDYNSGIDLMKTMMDLSSKGKTIVMVTHDLEYLKYGSKAIRIKDGLIEGIYQGSDKEGLERSVKTKRGSDDVKEENGSVVIDTIRPEESIKVDMANNDLAFKEPVEIKKDEKEKVSPNTDTDVLPKIEVTKKESVEEQKDITDNNVKTHEEVNVENGVDKPTDVEKTTDVEKKVKVHVPVLGASVKKVETTELKEPNKVNEIKVEKIEKDAITKNVKNVSKKVSRSNVDLPVEDRVPANK